MKSATLAVALAAMAGTLISPAVFADEAKTSADPNRSTNALRVVKDKETGQLRAPTAEELQAMIQRENAAAGVGARARSATAAPTTVPMPETNVVKRHSNGMVSVQMSRESLSKVRAVKDANGNVQVIHENQGTKLPREEK